MVFAALWLLLVNSRKINIFTSVQRSRYFTKEAVFFVFLVSNWILWRCREQPQLLLIMLPVQY